MKTFFHLIKNAPKIAPKLVFGGAILLALSACGADNSKSGDTATATAPTSDKVIKIATESNFKPFSYLDTSGNLVGFEIDLANALCQQIQAQCTIHSHDWDSLIPSLNTEQFDAVMAGMSVTPDRLEAVDFSDPYFNNTLVFVGKKGDNTDLNNADGKTVAVQQATVSADYLTKNHPKVTVKSYDKQDNAYLDLSAGRADYMLSDIVPISDWLKTEQGTNFEIKGEPIDINDKVAIAVKKGNNELVTQFNIALAELKQNGEYDKIVAQYFDNTK